MANVILQNRIVYGLKTNVVENVHHITDGEILYPVGNAIAIHNFPFNRQKLIRLSVQQINVIAVTPNKKYVAICEVGEKPTISIYNLQTLKKKKTLVIPYETVGVTSFTCISFSFDSKCLVAIIDEPDQTMLFYNWEKGKVESSIKLGNPQNPSSMIQHVSCNPGDVGIVAVGGPYVLKFLTVSETVWRSYGFSKADNIIVCSMAWLNSEKLFAGTRDGRILYFENADLKNVYKMTEIDVIDLKVRTEHAIQAASQTNLAFGDEGSWEHDVRCLVEFQRGFAFAHGFGNIVIFEKDGQNRYVKRNIYVVPQLVSKRENKSLYKINTINVSPSYEKIVVTTGWSQIFYTNLWGDEAKEVPQLLKPLGQPLHHGPIGGLSMCSWKPIFMTYGEEDRSVRIWNFENETLILEKQYLDDIYSISLHPTGLFCLVSFSDKLRFLTILLDDLKVMQEFPIRNCKAVRFSHGGHFFAAVDENVILTYTTINFQNRFSLMGHTGKIQGMVWSHSDTKLYSIGLEGAIYEWDMSTGARTAEVILKGILLRDLAEDFETSTCYCISDDNFVREIKENNILREFQIKNKDVHLIRITRHNSNMFITCSNGIILSLKWPIQETVEYFDFHLHCGDISQIALTPDEQLLITTGKDGILCFWKVMYEEENVIKDRDQFYTEEVLIGKSELESKIHNIHDLVARLSQLESEHVYKMRQMEMQHDEKMKEVHQTYREIIKELKEKLDKQEESRVKELSNINDEIVKMKSAHEKAMQQIETSYESKLIAEYDKYKALEDRNNAMIKDYELKLETLKNSTIVELEQVTAKYEAYLHTKDNQLKEKKEELSHQAQMHETMQALIEDDADREIVEIRTKYENELYKERQTILTLKGDVGALRNRIAASQEDIKALREDIRVLTRREEKYRNTIGDLERDKLELRKELKERDATIQNQESVISDLNAKNQELKKYTEIMDYKISELESQIEPKEKNIQEMQEKLHLVDEESRHLYKINTNLKVQLADLQEKLSAARRQIQAEIQKNKKIQLFVKNMQIDLYNAADLIQQPQALKKLIVNMFHRYCNKDEMERIQKADLDVQQEFRRQRDHLERTVSLLRKQLLKKNIPEKNIKLEKIVQENTILITELNTVRRELGSAQNRIKDMEKFMKSKGYMMDSSDAKNNK